MNKKSAEIKTELDQTTERLNELAEQRDAASDILQNLQSGFIAGTVSLEDLQLQQSKVTVLTASVDALDAKRSELETDLKAAESAELRTDIIRQLAEAAAVAANSHSEYIQVTDELDGILKGKSSELLDLVAVVIENRQKFRKLYLQIVPPDKETISVPGADIYPTPKVLSELQQTGISPEELRVATTGVLAESDAEFSGIITMAKQIATQKRFAFKQGQGVLVQ